VLKKHTILRADARLAAARNVYFESIFAPGFAALGESIVRGDREIGTWGRPLEIQARREFMAAMPEAGPRA
jgi:hypothetical protein